MVLLVLCTIPVAAGDILEFRLAQSDPTENWTPVEFEGENLWLSPSPELTSVHVVSAELQWPQPENSVYTNQYPQILIKFSEHGASLFAKVTGENQGKHLAILSDGTILTAPVIRCSITGGIAVIQGKFSKDEARELVKKLNSNLR